MKPSKERFEQWFDDPVTALLNFLNSGQAIMSVVFEEGGRNRIVELNQRDAAHLLEEYGVVREEEE
jgi:hypothetical protein